MLLLNGEKLKVNNYLGIMNNKILFLFLIIFFVSSNKSFSQTFEIKVGTALYQQYEINNVHKEPYYYDADYDINAGLMISSGVAFDLSQNFSLGIDIRLRNLNGKANGIYAGYSPFDSSDVFKSWDFAFTNLDGLVKIKYRIDTQLGIKISPFAGIGYSENMSFDRQSTQEEIARTPPDMKIIYLEEPSGNNSGFLLSTGASFVYEVLLIELGIDVALFKTHIYEAGNFKLLNFNILFGVSI